MMQVPFKIQVSVSFSVISDFLPQKGGQFYSLAKSYDTFGPKPGSDNWLSDNMQQEQLKLLRDEKTTADKLAKENAAVAARSTSGTSLNSVRDNSN
jgi:hypothetical protein